MSRIYFSAWGRGLDRLELPAYAMLDGLHSSADCVYAAIARRNRLHVCGGPRSDGVQLNRYGDPEARHYQATLGTACRGGGFTPVAEVWISIPVKL
jgi:hypothetical protein